MNGGQRSSVIHLSHIVGKKVEYESRQTQLKAQRLTIFAIAEKSYTEGPRIMSFSSNVYEMP